MRPINYMAPINKLGYGVAGYNLLKALMQSGAIVCYFPIGKPEWEGDPLANQIVNGAAGNAKFFDHNAPSIKVWHQNDMALFPGRGPRVGFPIFELNRFKDDEKHHLSSLDRILVCSEWAKRVVEDNGISVPVSVVPLGVDQQIFHISEEDKKARPYWTRDTTVFMNVGKWEVRKGHNELLEAFCKAFTPKDNVELRMMNDNPFIGIQNEIWKQKYLDSSMGEKIKILHRAPSQHGLRQEFNQIDCGVFPSHAEGWNLEILEMMACGANIIATDYSGHTEFLNDDNSYLLRPNGMQIAKDGVWFHGHGEWCSYNIDELVALMRKVHENKQTGKLGDKSEAMRATVEKFTWNNSANKLLEAIK